MEIYEQIIAVTILITAVILITNSKWVERIVIKKLTNKEK